MTGYKIILGTIAATLAFISFVPYFRDIYSDKTRPHIFSWLIWTILLTIGFVVQVVGHGGAGAWVTGADGLVCLIIFLVALSKGEKNITWLDWLSLGGAGLALILWAVTKGPLLSVILVAIIDALGFVPTYRKSFSKPDEETVATYGLSGLQFVVGILALSHFSIITALYPISLIVTNWGLVILLVVRRNLIKN